MGAIIFFVILGYCFIGMFTGGCVDNWGTATEKGIRSAIFWPIVWTKEGIRMFKKVLKD